MSDNEEMCVLPFCSDFPTAFSPKNHHRTAVPFNFTALSFYLFRCFDMVAISAPLRPMMKGISMEVLRSRSDRDDNFISNWIGYWCVDLSHKNGD